MPKYNLDNLQELVKPEDVTDLFGENKGKNIDFEEELKKREGIYIVDVDITRLMPNANNKFSQIEGEQYEAFKASIKEYGIMQPIIVRPIYREKNLDLLEIIAGHNRVRAAKELGMEKVPAIISDIDDVDASVIIGITNNQRENTTELEWGWAYRNTYEALKKSVGRPKINNIESQPALVETDLENNDENKLSLAGTIKRTDAVVAEKYGVGRNTVQRKIRLTYLEQPIYLLYESKKINQDIAIELSYLNKIEQCNVAALREDGFKLTLEIAKRFRELAGKLNIDEIKRIWTQEGEIETKKVRPKKYTVDDTLFPAKLKKGDRESYIIKALRYIKENDIEV